MAELLIPGRCNGPAASGNGGWAGGTLAGLLAEVPGDHAAGCPPVTVTLRRPLPLDTPVPVVDGVAADGEGTIATAEVVEEVLRPVEEVGADVAADAERSYAGLGAHPFPTCFACGPERAAGDGLRIFPGRVADDAEGRVRVAATWTPHPDHAEDWHAYGEAARRASLAVTWAALDCVGGWAGDLTERPMVLGRMTARIDTLPVVGEPHVVVGLARGREGRRTATAATLYDSAGRLVGVAEHTWITVDPAVFNRLRTVGG